MKIYSLFLKRVIDLMLASIGFVVMFPVFLVVWIILLIKNDGKAFFYQERPGKNEIPFKIIKFNKK